MSFCLLWNTYHISSKPQNYISIQHSGLNSTDYPHKLYCKLVHINISLRKFIMKQEHVVLSSIHLQILELGSTPPSTNYILLSNYLLEMKGMFKACRGIYFKIKSEILGLNNACSHLTPQLKIKYHYKRILW
jgi:hypothetical protein